MAYTNRGSSYKDMTPEQRRAFIDRISEYRRKYQNDSLATATKHGDYWTEDEDELLFELREQGVTEHETATLLHRTYSAICGRFAYHRRLAAEGRTAEYSQDGRNASHLRDDDRPANTAPLLCACGTLDDDHEDWCPSS